MEDITKKITLVDVERGYYRYTNEKRCGVIGPEESNLFTTIKNILKKKQIALTTVTAYHICAAYFDNENIIAWDKSKYNKILRLDFVEFIKDYEQFKIVDVD